VKKYFYYITIRVIIIIAVLNFIVLKVTNIYAWGDNGGGRPDYTIEEINNGAIGATEISDGENYKESENYPGTIVFNSISDSVIGHEKNFVGTRECFQRADSTWIGATKETIWNADEIPAKNNRTYIIRAYVHNNNPNGESAVAENTKVAFSVPSQSATEAKVTGYISSSNATPSEYWDSVVFKSDRAFHLEYVYGSALLENNGIGKGGLTLSDEIVTKASAGGTLIGYDKLDGRVPGCYQYDNYVSIKVKVVFDYEFTTETRVRLEGEKNWQDTVTANIGDKVEFQIEYWNTSNEWQNGVVINDILPPNLRYVPGSTKIKNSSHPNGAVINEDHIIGNGIQVGDYGPDANVYVIFTAEVVDDSLAGGQNTLINWGRVSVNGEKVIPDYAGVQVSKSENGIIVIAVILLLIIICCLVGIVALIIKMRHQR
jgi:uncharacterized repeat protein (TIGR01451 family)